MKTAAQLNDLLTQYRWLCQEIEWLKHRIVVGRYPVESQRWKSWKARQVRKSHVEQNSTTLPELSDNPQYQHLLKLKDQLNHVWFEIMDGDSFEAEENLLRDVAMSFPSLHKVYDPHLSAWAVETILCDGESVSPQAYHAALFVVTLGSIGRHRYKSDPIFFIDRAFEVWNDEHKEAFVRWIGMPYFPADEFRRLSVEQPSI